jgi:hypothetical protein
VTNTLFSSTSDVYKPFQTHLSLRSTGLQPNTSDHSDWKAIGGEMMLDEQKHVDKKGSMSATSKENDHVCLV